MLKTSYIKLSLCNSKDNLRNALLTRNLIIKILCFQLRKCEHGGGGGVFCESVSHIEHSEVLKRERRRHYAGCAE